MTYDDWQRAAGAEMDQERCDWIEVETWAADHAAMLARCWRLGDGDGGYLLDVLRRYADRAGR